MKSIREILNLLPFGILGIILLIIFIPFWIVLLPILLIIDYKFKKKYNQYLNTIEGRNFFCYNNRKKGKVFIENEIIPLLPLNVEIVYLNGREIETEGFNKRFLSHSFYQFKNYSKFPQLLKIRNGKTIDISINNLLHNTISQNKTPNNLIKKIEEFFD